MKDTHLKGLSSENPLDFLAALGVQFIATSLDSKYTMRWDGQVETYPVIFPEVDYSVISKQALAIAKKCLEGSALDPKVHTRLYLNAEEIRTYLGKSREDRMSSLLARCLVAEGSLASTGKRLGKAQTSALDFTAGGKEVLNLIRKILCEVTEAEIEKALLQTDSYSKGHASLSWDLMSDRVYAYRSDEPTASNNIARPGVEALAILGLGFHPCFGNNPSIMTQGCGKLDSGIRVYTWPIWHKAISLKVTSSLLAHASHATPYNSSRVNYYKSWGIRKVLQSQIRIRGQGHGSFGPPEVIWQYGRDS